MLDLRRQRDTNDHPVYSTRCQSSGKRRFRFTLTPSLLGRLVATGVWIRLEAPPPCLRAEQRRARSDRRTQGVEGCAQIRATRREARLSDIIIRFDPQFRFRSSFAASACRLFRITAISGTLHRLSQGLLLEEQGHSRRQNSAPELSRSSAAIHLFLAFAAGVTMRSRSASSSRSADCRPGP